MGGQALCVELRVLVRLELLKPLAGGRRLLLQLECSLGLLLLLLLKLGRYLLFPLLLEGFLVNELPNGSLARLAVFQLDAQIRQHVVAELVAQLEDLFGSLVSTLLHLIPISRKRIHQRRNRIFDVCALTVGSRQARNVVFFVNAESL